MSKKDENNEEFEPKAKKNAEVEDSANEAAETTENNSETSADENVEKEKTPEEKIAELEQQLEKEKKEYLFLMADFDNFRKRTMKEKIEIMKNGAEKAMLDILPVIDDFERALQAMSEQSDIDSLKEGVELIYNKFIKYLESNGVKAIDSNKAEFDTELHEAVANFPTPEEDLKGKVIDTVQKGYKINDKVLRHAKVVVGQ